MQAFDAKDWPFPMAYTYRLFCSARSPRDQLSQAGLFMESVIHTLGLLCAGWAVECQPDLTAVATWKRALEGTKGLSLGHWIEVIRGVTKLPGSPLRPWIEWSGTADPPLVAHMVDYLTYRNADAHGARPRHEPAVERDLAMLAEIVEEMRSKLSNFGLIRLYRVDRTAWREREFGYDVDVDVLAGSDTTFSHARRRSSRPLEEHAVVAVAESDAANSADLAGGIILSPYCLAARCTTCNEPELFYVVRIRASGTKYRSFERGHLHEAPSTKPVQGRVSDPPRTRPDPVPAAAATLTTERRGTPPPVSMFRRLIARIGDLLPPSCLLAAIYLISRSWGFATWVAILVGLPLAFAYEPLLRAPAKRLLGVEVVDVRTGRPVGRLRTLGRASAVGAQIAFPALAVVSMYWIRLDPARQAMHDVLCRTIVVRRSERQSVSAGRKGPTPKEEPATRPVLS